MKATTVLKASLGRVKRSLKAETFAGASNALFGGVSDRLSPYLRYLEADLEESRIDVLYRTYLSEMLMASFLAGFAGLMMALTVSYSISPGTLFSATLILMLPTGLGILAFLAMYLFPAWKARKRSQDINRNLPFALNHMSAIAGSGVPPSSLFGLLVNFEEYGEISEEADEIVTRVEVLGEDVSTALREVADQTPSEELKEVFFGMISTLETGGNLKDYLEERSDRALFNYRLKREKQIDRLTTFASFYMALLVAAPLFLITILAVLETVGGGLLGHPIKARCGFLGALQGQCPMGIIDVGAFVIIPVANILFLVVLEVAQPEI